ncbi:uncharacterized protein DS421_15g493960 [Arachis hypogaea]|nr:uncharacterized protein DS421_15g493960 [Arachis hypogaea]
MALKVGKGRKNLPSTHTIDHTPNNNIIEKNIMDPSLLAFPYISDIIASL